MTSNTKRLPNILSRIHWTLRHYQLFNIVRHLSISVLLIGVVLIGLGIPGVVSGTVPYPPIPSWLVEMHQELASELVGAGLAVIVIDSANRWAALLGEKKRLIRELASKDNATAYNSAEELRDRGWLMDGSLQHAYLSRANLHGVDLWHADLREAKLLAANLCEAILWHADLRRADLSYADLRKASLWNANLQDVEMIETDLRGAKRLRCDQLLQAKLLLGARLPDGTAVPYDEDWRDFISSWCEAAEVDKEGHIVPAEVDIC